MTAPVKKTCKNCGLIQPWDILYGFAICDSAKAAWYGCPSRELVNEHYPDWEYDQEIYEKKSSDLYYPVTFMNKKKVIWTR